MSTITINEINYSGLKELNKRMNELLKSGNFAEEFQEITKAIHLIKSAVKNSAGKSRTTLNGKEVSNTKLFQICGYETFEDFKEKEKIYHTSPASNIKFAKLLASKLQAGDEVMIEFPTFNFIIEVKEQQS